jgi:HK97 family phage major capsid protein
MPVQQKSRAANEFRAKADQILAELADPTRTFTKDEVEARSAEASTLLSRAQAVAGFTPKEEIEDQGGDAALIGRRSPEGAEPEPKTYKTEMADLAKRVEEEFGGPNSLILALARQSVSPLTSRQHQVLQAIRALQARTITGEVGNASKAEVLLPLQQVASIFTAPVEVGGMFSIATRYNVSGRTLRLPYLVQDGSNNVNRPMASIANVTIVGEAGEKPLREPKFDERLLTVFKYAAYTEFADEMLADDFTGDLAPTVQNSIGSTIINKINEDITMDGTGTAMPLGAFYTTNPAVYKQVRSGAGTFTATDAFNMYSRHVLGPQSRWFIHPSVLPQLMSMTLNGTTLVTFIQSLQGTPTMQLLGIPIVVTPLVSLLGLEGDVCLGNGAFYAMALRQALTVESSIHYRFRNDVTAYRFYARAGGIPIPTGLYSYKRNTTTSANEYNVSPFVVLDDVYAS